MAEASPSIAKTSNLDALAAHSPLTRQLAVSLTATNYIAQYSAGAAIDDDTGPWTVFSPTRLPQVVVGGSGVETVFTLVGVAIDTGEEFTQTVTVSAGGGTEAFGSPVASIVEFSSDVDPEDTVDLQAGDTWVHPAARSAHVGVAGDIACRLKDDDADATLVDVQGGECPRQMKVIRITSTTATDLVLGW